MKILVIMAVLLLATTSFAKDIGQWRDDAPGVASNISIYTSNGSYYLKQVFDRDGSKLVEKLKKSGNKYTKPGSQDYYIIDSDGTFKCFDRQGLVYEASPVNRPKVASSDPTSGLSCYDIGVKYGRCATLSMKGKACSPKDDIAVPERCRGNADTQRGIAAGTKSVY